MKQWTRWGLITATVPLLACALLYHAHERIQRRQALAPQSSLVYDSSAESKGVTARITAKYRVAGEVVAGRMSLLQAAVAFRSLDQHWPHVIDAGPGSPKAASEVEVYCLKVIAYVRSEAPLERVAELANRLQAELDAMLRNGTLRLPDADDALSSGGG